MVQLYGWCEGDLTCNKLQPEMVKMRCRSSKKLESAGIVGVWSANENQVSQSEPSVPNSIKNPLNDVLWHGRETSKR